MFVHVLLAHQAMTPDGQSVIAGEDDISVLKPPVGSKLVDDSAHLLVDMIDHGVINGQFLENFFLGTRPRQ